MQIEKSLHQFMKLVKKMADSIIAFFADEKEMGIISRLKQAGINFSKDNEESESGGKLNGLTFVLTGEMKSFSRKSAQELIESLGGKVSSAVSKNTDFVVVGENPGSKFKKAKELDIKILNEDGFIEMIGASKANEK